MCLLGLFCWKKNFVFCTCICLSIFSHIPQVYHFHSTCYSPGLRYSLCHAEQASQSQTVNILSSVFVLFWQLQGLFPLPLAPLCISCGYNFFFQTVFVCQRCRALTYANRELKSACVMQSKHPFRDGAVVGRLSHILLALISILARRHCFHCFLLNIVVLIQSCFLARVISLKQNLH